MKSTMLAVLCAVALSSSGCYRTVINTPAASERGSYVKGGPSLMALTDVTANADECRYGIARAQTRLPVWAFFTALFTGFIITGMEAEYVCARASDSSPNSDHLTSASAQ